MDSGSDAYVKSAKGLKDDVCYDVKRWSPQMEGEGRFLGEKHTQQLEMMNPERKEIP